MDMEEQVSAVRTSMVGKLLQDTVRCFDALLVLLQLILRLLGHQRCTRGRTARLRATWTYQELLEQRLLLIGQLSVFWDLRHRSVELQYSDRPGR
jgi:hypothetical protein